MNNETNSKKFSDLVPALTNDQAIISSDSCYFCHDAPCIKACPTSIDIPNFIRKIQTNNIKGAGVEILKSNILGGTCARACPVEVLCEQACVRTKQQHKPVEISRLQRYATDWILDNNIQPFSRGDNNGYSVAIIGSGPAGLACAHELAKNGCSVTIYEQKAKAGGLNEHGLAAYKMTNNFAQREIDFILDIGGIEIITNAQKDIDLSELKQSYDALFIATGLTGFNKLLIPGEDINGVINSVDFIKRIRQSNDLSTISTGKKVVVIGGGNTAIDIATQVKLLGAEDVTIVYRGTKDSMAATIHEQELTKIKDVTIRYNLQPKYITSNNKQELTNISFENLNGEIEDFNVDIVFKAIGQHFILDSINPGKQILLKLDNGKIAVDANMMTSVPGIFAGGDCVNKDDNLTVYAVEHGKVAGRSILQMLKKAEKETIDGRY